MQRLFVYGTLAPGEINHHRLQTIDGDWRPAILRGRLRQQGWGAQHGCPGIVPDDQGEAVQGHVLSSKDLDQHWADLDAFEGDGYRRTAVRVRFDDGEEAEAFVYALAESD